MIEGGLWVTREQIMDKILDSKDATVGGGSASALAAAMAAGMGGMVARLSSGKNLGLPDTDYVTFADSLDSLSKELVQGAALDAAAFSQISSAFKLPKATGEEKTIRSKAIEEAGIAAASAPLQNAKLAVDVIAIFDQFLGKHNPNAESDLMIGRHFLNVALYGFAANIEANLSLIKTVSKKAVFESEAAELRKKSGL